MRFVREDLAEQSVICYTTQFSKRRFVNANETQASVTGTSKNAKQQNAKF